MAETTKKFLDFTGLQKYDELLKAKVAADIKVVQDDLDTRKVKDTADSTTITWSKAENGTYTASVKGVVLDDTNYADVKTKATQSAAAWTKFLEGSTGAYPDGITPALKDLATKTEVTDGDASTLASAKLYADGLASNYAPVSHTHVIADVTGLQTALDGKAAIDHNHDTVYSKLDHNHDDAYDVKGAAAQALVNAKSYVDDKVDGKFDVKGAAAQALVDAKNYADTNFDTKGSAATAKTEAISEANTYTNGEIKKVDDQIKAINTSIAGGVHFIGISTTEITDTGTQTPTIDGWTGPVKTGDIVINNAGAEIIWDGTKWQKLGDTTAELERIADLEGHVNILRGNDTVEGSVAKALADAKAFTTGEINTLVGSTGQVGKNTAAIAVLNGGETTPGSVAKALADAKAYADGVGSDAQSHTDTKIAELVGASGQVGKNTAAIATLNGNSSTKGSVDYKIAQAVSNIEASIETITETDINTLFGK